MWARYEVSVHMLTSAVFALSLCNAVYMLYCPHYNIMGAPSWVHVYICIDNWLDLCVYIYIYIYKKIWTLMDILSAYSPNQSLFVFSVIVSPANGRILINSCLSICRHKGNQFTVVWCETVVSPLHHQWRWCGLAASYQHWSWVYLQQHMFVTRAWEYCV